MSDYSAYLVHLRAHVASLSDAMRNHEHAKADRLIAESKMYLALLHSCVHRLERDAKR